jgi:hypothetical protein
MKTRASNETVVIIGGGLRRGGESCNERAYA